MVAYLFAGQGSQYVGMGRDLYETFPESKQVFDKADRALGFSFTKLCFEGPQEKLTQTQNCQPAILAVSIAAWEAFKSVFSYPLPAGKQGLSVLRYTAGLSLGEYSALVAAEAINFEDAVYLVRRRGEFMEDEARKNPGRMLSIIGLSLDNVKEICANTNTEIANLNCPGQIVISGGLKDIEKAQELAVKQGVKKALLLEVSGAFHSSLMREASNKLAKELVRINISEPRMTLVSNVTAKSVKSADEIKDSLIKQITSGVLWEESMRFILSQGISKFFEFGPGKVLRGLMSRIDENAQVVNIEKKEDILNLVD